MAVRFFDLKVCVPDYDGRRMVATSGEMVEGRFIPAEQVLQMIRRYREELKKVGGEEALASSLIPVAEGGH